MSTYQYKWALFIDYGYGWEYELFEDTLAEVKQRRKEYMINVPQFPTKIAKKRINKGVKI